jgi:Flp pilus assembly pilin Flp
MIDRLNAMFVEIALYMPARAKERLQNLKSQDGQAFVEYALVLTLVAVAVALLAQWGTFTNALAGALNRVENVLKNSGTSGGATT